MQRLSIKFLVILAAAALAAATTPAHAAEKWLRIENHREAFPIWKVFITAAGDDSWGRDQLGGEVISVGETMTWNIPWGGCFVDMKVETFTGLTATRSNVNICGGFTWKIFDD